MTTGTLGVAISTTGHPHRIGMLEACVKAWSRALPLGEGAALFVTVDGTEEDVLRVREAVFDYTGSVFRVGRPAYPGDMDDNHRLGVAANKNTGLELLMDNTRADHLFLCDDDTWPLYPASLDKHIDLGLPHSMVMWGKHRLHPESFGKYVEWTWPRGAMLYVHRTVVDQVGGMDERFGLGGHEHAEWSQRIHNAGLTPAPFVSPLSYATRDCTGAGALWHIEDMPMKGEPRHVFNARKNKTTTISQTRAGWEQIDKIMREREGSSDFVSFRAHENGRSSATLFQNIPSQGAEESK